MKKNKPTEEAKNKKKMDLPGGHGGGCGLSWRAKEEKGGGRRGEEGRKKEEEEGRREGEEQIDEGRSMNGRKKKCIISV